MEYTQSNNKTRSDFLYALVHLESWPFIILHKLLYTEFFSDNLDDSMDYKACEQQQNISYLKIFNASVGV